MSSRHFGDAMTTPTPRWDFNEIDAHGFEQHARRSIPLYDEGHQITCDVSDFFTPAPARILEIGCSTGLLLNKLSQHHHQRKDISLVGMDVSSSMLEVAKTQTINPHIEWILGDACTEDLGKNDLIIAYYTVQFIPPRFRQDLISKIYESLNWGGALLMFEKVRGPDARFQDLLTTLYTDYKIQNGFKPDEIVSKTKSLKGVLEPFSTTGNLDLMKRAGFVDITTIMKYLCFEGFLAIK